MKKGIKLPIYVTTTSGPPHKPVFSSTVNVDGKTFDATGAKRVDAETNAAQKAVDSFRCEPSTSATDGSERSVKTSVPEGCHLLIDIENMSQFPKLLKKYHITGEWTIVHSPNYNAEVLVDVPSFHIRSISSRHRDGADIAIVVFAVMFLGSWIELPKESSKKVYVATKDLFAEALKDVVRDGVGGVGGEVIPIPSMKDLEKLLESWS